MADDVDVTAQRLEREMEALLRRRAKAGPRSTGACLWCEAPLPDGQRWCDADCRDDWERAHSRRTALMGDRHT